MKKKRTKRLSGKMALIISGMLSAVFIILIIVTVSLSQKAINATVSSELTAISQSNGAEVRKIIEEGISLGETINSYLMNALEEEGQGTVQAGSTGGISRIFKKPVTLESYVQEDFMLETARSCVENNIDITGVTVMSEPYTFDSNIRDYSFYISEDTVDSDIGPFDTYENYSKQEYYSIAKENKKLSFTEPYEFEGKTMVSAATPILYNNEVLGVVTADMNVSSFSRIQSTSSRYPSMFTRIYSDKGTIVYDSQEEENIGKNISEFFQNQKDWSLVQEKMQKGESFTVDTQRTGGIKVRLFFNPVEAGDSFWWSTTTVERRDMNAVVNEVTFWLIVISVLALILIVTVVIITLRRMLLPIQDVVKAAESISSGQFDIQLTSKSEDEIGELTKTFDLTARILKAVIADMTRVLNGMAGKDLTVVTETEYVGELGRIKDAMNHITQNFNRVMGEISQSADQVATGSQQVADGAQALAQGATEQSGSIEELVATINNISMQIKENARNAEQASGKAAKVGSEMAESNRRMQEMKEAMDEISARSGEIGKIIKTIEDIAFQTNILALNAAVEAARAGEAGKGFAVVAEEVRSLAIKSAEASQNTAALIEDSIRAVEHGVKITEETAEALLGAVEGAKEVTASVNSISNASSRQAEAINQVSQGVEQISSVVQNNSATAEESAATSQEMSGQAQMLQMMVGEFNLKKETNVREVPVSLVMELPENGRY